MIRSLTELLSITTSGLDGELKLRAQDDFSRVRIFAADEVGLAFAYAGSDAGINHRPWHSIDNVRIANEAYKQVK